jgi:glycosyltransferase involved in cell wall biosynthesis
LEWFSTVLDFGIYDRLAARLERVSLRRASVATAESTFTATWLRDHYPRLDVHHVEYSPSWLFYQIKRRPQVKPLRFLFVGVLSSRKGSDMLLWALDRLRGELDFRLIIAGLPQPEFVSKIKSQTSSALWERIEILQNPPTSVVIEQLSQATTVLFPARAETGPLAVKEAAVAGVPVVGSVTGGIPDYISPGKNGMLFPPGDLDGFVDAIRKASAHPLFGLGQVDKSALIDVRDRLSPRRMAEGFVSIYRQLAKSRAGIK